MMPSTGMHFLKQERFVQRDFLESTHAKYWLIETYIETRTLNAIRTSLAQALKMWIIINQHNEALVSQGFCF